MPLAQLSASINVRARSTNNAGSRQRVDDFSVNNVLQFAIGTGASPVSANKAFSDRRTLNNTTENLDLSGSLSNGVGDSCVFTTVRLVYIKNTSAAGNLTVDTEVANGASTLVKSVTLGPGDDAVFRYNTGRGVTAGTADLLRVTTTANVVYEILIAGE